MTTCFVTTVHKSKEHKLHYSFSIEHEERISLTITTGI